MLFSRPELPQVFECTNVPVLQCDNCFEKYTDSDVTGRLLELNIYVSALVACGSQGGSCFYSLDYNAIIVRRAY